MAEHTRPTEHTHSSHHITSRKTYFLVFAALMVLTVLTWLVAQVDLGWANDLVALTIAFTKMMLVLLFFMHVRHSTRMTILTAAAGFFWLAIMLFYTLSDYFTRGASVLPVLGK